MHFFYKIKQYPENTPSLFLLVTPYLLITYPSIKDFAIFSWFYFILLFCGLLLIDIGYRKIFQYLKSNNSKITNFLHGFYVIVFLMFFGFFFITAVNKVGFETNIDFRGRYAVPLVFVVLLVVILKNKRFYSFFNRGLIILSVLILLNSGFASFKSSGNDKSAKLISKRIAPPTHKSSKPLILILLDEYSSPLVIDSINNHKQADLCHYLDSTGWIVNRKSPSKETFTAYSISSLLNYNLSVGNNYSNLSGGKISGEFDNATMVKDIERRNIAFENYSFFKVYNHPKYRYLFSFPDSFFDLVMMNSMYFSAKLGTDGFNTSAMFKTGYYASSDYNIAVYNVLNTTLNQHGTPDQFKYIHLLMPHAPIHFGNEINLNGYGTSNYVQYWAFVNKKIIQALSHAKYLSDYRIIITGDHGYRNDKKIDPHLTMTAFYGFDKNDISNVKCVQDLGSFIEGSF